MHETPVRERSAKPRARRGTAGADAAAAGLLAAAATAGLSLLVVDLIAALTAGETSDRAAYVLVLGLLAPAGCLTAVGLARSGGAPRGDAGRGSAVLAALLVLATFVLRRVADTAGAGVSLSLLVTVLGLGAAAAAWRSAGARAGWLSRLALAAWCPQALVAGQMAAALLVLAPILPLTAWLRGAVFALVLSALLLVRRPDLKRGPGRLLDLAGVALIALVLTDLSVVTQPASFPFFGQFHHNFFLAPVSDILHGKALLVETIPPYGPGLHVALAAVFSVVPLGYATFGLIVMALTSVQYAVLYVALRVAGAPFVLALGAVLGIVAACVYSSFAPPVLLPSTVGARHLPGYIVALAAVLAASGTPSAARWRILALAGLAVAGAWSAEALVFSLAAWLGAAGVRCGAEAQSRASGLRALAAESGWGVLAAATGVGLLSAGVVAWTGEAPEWGAYLDYIRAYNSWPQFAIAAQPWAPVLLAGAVYTLSLVGLGAALPVAGRGGTPRSALAAIAAFTLLGAATLSYAVTRSDDFAVLSVATPAAVVVVLWATLLLGLGSGRRSLAAALAAALVPGLLLGAGWSGMRQRLHDTAPGLLVAGVPALVDALQTSWAGPPVLGQAREAENVLRRVTTPRAAVLLGPDLQVEALIRARTANALPLGHPVSDSLVGERTWARLAGAIRQLPVCTPLLTQIDLVAAVRAAPVPDTITIPALERIRGAFRLTRVHVSRSGLLTARLVPKRAPRNLRCPPVPR